MRPLNLSWRVVLVRPRNPLNIGAAARAVANFGLLDLAVVAPFEPTWQEARTSAVGGEAVLDAARATSTLMEAIGNATIVIGTTTGARRNLGRDLLPLPELPAWLRRRRAKGKAALLFGSEKTGLSNDDMSHCQALTRIPTYPGSPSMNLGQAVAVCAYELARAGIASSPQAEVAVQGSAPANMQALDHIFARATSVLDIAGYFQPKSRAAMLRKLRQLLLDLNLTGNDIRILGGALAQIEWKLGQMQAPPSS